MDNVAKLLWTEDGFKSFEDVITYIGKDSEYYARNFAKKLIAAVERLKEFPRSGKVVPEYNNPNMRELIYQNYRIVYKIDGSVIYIALLVHGSKELPPTQKIFPNNS